MSSAPVGAATVDGEVYFDEVGTRLVGVDPVASADLSRIALLPDPRRIGPVAVFDSDGVRWSQVGADIDGGSPKAMSGDGQRVVIGVATAGPGRVRVHEWGGAGWSPLGASLRGDADEDGFGTSVVMSADGDRVAIGAPGGDSGAGYVRVFEWDGAGWSQIGADIDGDAAGDGFGWSVAMTPDGDRVAISERRRFVGESFEQTVEGAMRVFDWDGAEWSQVGGELDAVGDDVALSASGDRLAAGIRGDWDVGPPGRSWIFDLVGGDWTMVDYSEGRPVQSVALSADGSRFVYSGNKLNGPVDSSPGETVVREERAGDWVDVGVVDGLYSISGDDWVALSADGNRMAIGGSGFDGRTEHVRVFDILESPPPPLAGPAPVVPARLLDSRVGAETVDGVSAGIGVRSAGSVTEVSVAGRGGVPADAAAVMLSVVAVRPDAVGYLTVFPCGTEPPLASNLNYAAGQVIANSVFIGLGTDGKVCIYTSAATHLVVDVSGHTPLTRSGLRPVDPHRLMDTREGRVRVGVEQWEEVDRLPAGSVTELFVGGWPVPYERSAVMLDVVAVRPEANGYLTVYPCGSPRPLASSVNFVAGQTVAKSVLTRVGNQRKVCFFTSATTDVVADVTGYTPDDSGLASLVPARLLDSRVGESTVDGVSAGIGRRPAGSVTVVPVAGRDGVPADASAVILDVVAVRPDDRGYLTVYPCGAPRPLASNLNFAAGQTIANAAFTGLGTAGDVCVYTSASTELVIDVSGHT